MTMRLAACLIVSAACLHAEDAREIVRRAMNLDTRNTELSKDYTYLEKSETKQIDSGGKVTQVESRTFDVSFLYGQPFRRLIERNGKPLDGKAEQKEREKLAKVSAQRANMSDSERRKQAAEQQKRREEARRFLSEVPDAYDFQILGEETRNGRPAWVIQGTPKPGYRPRDARAKWLPKFRGRLWVDKQLYQWVRAEAETLDTISLGLFVARLARGSTIEFEQTRVNDEVWLPQSVHVKLDARLALFKRVRGEATVAYSNYRKFQSESRILPASERQ